VWNEARPRKKAVPKTAADSARIAVALAFKTLATFLTISFLWSLWTSESLVEWQATMLQWRYWSWEAVCKIVIFLCVLGTAAIVVGRDQWMIGGAAAARKRKLRPFEFWKSAIGTTFVGVFFLITSISYVQSYMSPQLIELLSTIERPRLNANNAAQLQRGYYEDLIQVDRFNIALQDAQGYAPRNRNMEWQDLILQPREGLLYKETRPSVNFTYDGVKYTTNEWGMRDKFYPKKKPEGVYRIGIIGSSHMMGWKVSDNETSESLAEARLVEEGRPYELLNFSVNGYNAIQKSMLLKEKVVDFDVDAAFLMVHRNEKLWVVRHLASHIEYGTEMPDQFIRDVMDKAGVKQGDSAARSRIQLFAYGVDLVRWSFQEFIETCHANGIQAVFVLMPELAHDAFSDKEIVELLGLAESTGFDLILNLHGAYDGHAEEDLRISETDTHPNAKAHKLMSEALYNAIVQNEAFLSH